MFEMSTAQQQAALDAMGGENAASIMHFVLYLVGLMALLWLLLIVAQVWHATDRHHLEPGQLLWQVASAVLIVTVAGALITY